MPGPTATSSILSTGPGAADKADHTAQPVYKISLGLVEISALATLVGATSAEALALGIREGAAGLPWASMSSFGLIYVIRGFLAAAAGDRMREAFGLRSPLVDSAVGVSLPADPNRPSKAIESGTVIAVHTRALPEDDGFDDMQSEKTGSSSAAIKSEGGGVFSAFCLDRATASILDDAPASKQSGDPLPIHQYCFYELPPSHMSNQQRRYWILQVCSMAKLVEAYILWSMGARDIWWTSALPWFHGFFSACLLRLLGLSDDQPSFDPQDMMAGDLPSALRAGGAGKLVLGIPGNVRRQSAWTAVWSVGAALNGATLIIVFLKLGSPEQPQSAIYAWAGFQALWLLLRIAIYQFLALSGVQREGGAIKMYHSWEVAPTQLRRRALRLSVGLASQLILSHPRGTVAYQEDARELREIRGLLALAGGTLTESLQQGFTGDGLDILGVVGDVVYRGVGWLQGDLDSEDIYDCVLVFVRVKGVVHAVPSVRVLSGVLSQFTGDVEASAAGRLDDREVRGSTNTGLEINWIYWVPMVDPMKARGWIQVKALQVRGAVSVKELTPTELHKVLQGGSLNISFKTEDEVTKTLETSRIAARLLVKLLADIELQSPKDKP
jgi:hypothetical protein